MLDPATGHLVYVPDDPADLDPFRTRQALYSSLPPSLDAVLMRALQVGSPPSWETAPAEFQADLAALDRLNDATLWRIARTRATPAQMDRYQALLDKNANQTLPASERNELPQLRITLGREMPRKAHAASLLQWRGHQIPPADKL